MLELLVDDDQVGANETSPVGIPRVVDLSY